MSLTYKCTGRSPLSFQLEKHSVFFSDEQCLKIIETVLDENGQIVDFPGIVEEERWIRKQRVGIFHDVRYEARFHLLDNGTYLMLWLIQPSGWHWADDDGFGFSGDSSIMLYSVLDEKGNFTKKFELFSIDQTRYCDDFDAYVCK